MSSAQAIGPATLAGFKAQHSPAEVACDESLEAQYWSLLANESDVPADAWKASTADAQNDAFGINERQAQAWSELAAQTRGRVAIVWDDARVTPNFIELPTLFRGHDGAEAYAQFLTQAGEHLLSLLDADGAEFVLAEPPDAFEGAGALGYRVLYRRAHLGLPVFGEYIDVTLKHSDWCSDAWTVHVSGRWTRTLGVDSATAAVHPDEAASTALLAAALDDATIRSSVLGVYPPSLHLAYAIDVQGTTNGARDRVLVYVSGATGDVLKKSSQIRHADGNLAAYVGRPLEGNAKNARPLPHVYMYEDTEADLASPVSCVPGHTMPQTHGDPDKILGSTSYGGAYSNVTSSDPLDNSCRPTFVGHMSRI